LLNDANNLIVSLHDRNHVSTLHATFKSRRGVDSHETADARRQTPMVITKGEAKHIGVHLRTSAVPCSLNSQAPFRAAIARLFLDYRARFHDIDRPEGLVWGRSENGQKRNRSDAGNHSRYDGNPRRKSLQVQCSPQCRSTP
jgi:hypothetical protein